MQNCFYEFCQEAGLGSVYFYQSGMDPILIHRSGCSTLEKIKGHIQNKNRNSRIRIFDHKCNEIYEEDVRYIKNKLYLTTDGKCLDSKVMFFEFKPIQVIGKGGQAAVMLVQHKITGIQRALKFNLEDQVDQYLYLAREAVILENLHHKNIIKLHQYKLFPNRAEAILELEYLKGGSLLDYIYDNGPMSEGIARHIFKQIINGLEYCHQKNIIHRDLKLENIMISNIDNLQIKIIDFGLAYISGTGVKLNEEHNLGSLQYSSPEVLSNEIQSILPCVDIWALGVILYYLVFGQFPFQSKCPIQNKRNIEQCIYSIPKSASDTLKDLLKSIFIHDCNKRIKLIEIKKHIWLKGNLKLDQVCFLQELPTTSKETFTCENTQRNHQAYCIQQSKS